MPLKRTWVMELRSPEALIHRHLGEAFQLPPLAREVAGEVRGWDASNRDWHCI